MLKFKNWILIFILLLALVLRVFRLDDTPISLFGDEIDVGLQAYSILTTGKDYFGNTFPLMFQSFEESRLPLFIYSAVPMVGIFGLNEWGVRTTGVFWGILGILGIYLLTKELFKNEKIALLAALLLSITPWHLQFSRQGGMEAEFLLTILTFALWFFLKGLDNFKFLIISITLFALSFYVYATSALFVSLFALSLLIIYFKKIKLLGFKKQTLLSLTVIFLLIPFITLILSGKATERSGKISVFNYEPLTKDIIDRRNIENNTLPAKIFHNKLVTFSTKLSSQYLSAFSAEFLLFGGDPNLRHGPDMGMLYFFQFILIVSGVIAIFKLKQNSKALWAWAILAPIPSIITQDGGIHGPRLILLLLPLTIVQAQGLEFLLNGRKGSRGLRIVLAVIFILIATNLTLYFHRYYNDYRRDSWRFWQTGYKEVMLFIKEIDKDYSNVYFNNTYEPAIPRFLFWNQYSIEKFRAEFNAEPKRINDEFLAITLNKKYHFGKLIDIDKYRGLDKLLKPGDIYVVSYKDEANSDWRKKGSPPNTLLLKTITNPFDQPIFFIVTKR